MTGRGKTILWGTLFVAVGLPIGASGCLLLILAQGVGPYYGPRYETVGFFTFLAPAFFAVMLLFEALRRPQPPKSRTHDPTC